MTRDIMTEWLSSFDKKIGRQGRKVLLFMDNASSHPRLELKNNKIIFLPPNTTAACQPLDQGIIKYFKINYRKCILRHLVARIDSSTSANDLAKGITVLDAIQWTTASIKQIKKETVVNCFRKSRVFSFKRWL